MKASFEDRMVAHMRERYPQQFAAYTRELAGDEGARRVIRRAVEKATALGARRESSIQQLLEMMLELTPEFDLEPDMVWVRSIFEDTTLSGGTRILLAHQKLPEHLARAGRNAT